VGLCVTEEAENTQDPLSLRLMQKDFELLSKRVDHVVEIFDGKYVKKAEMLHYGWPITLALVFAAGAFGVNFWNVEKIKEGYEKAYEKYAADLKSDYESKIKKNAEDQKAEFSVEINKQKDNFANDAKVQMQEKLQETIRQSSDRITDDVTARIREEVKKNASNIADKEMEASLSKYFGKNYSQTLKRIDEAAKNFSVDSGWITCDALEKDKDKENNQIYEKNINYNHTFSRKPFVLISVNGIVTTTKDDNLNLWVTAEDGLITKKGFKLKVKTSSRNSTSDCKIHWLAIDEFSQKNPDFSEP
jgi:hypothetical protein